MTKQSVTRQMRRFAFRFFSAVVSTVAVLTILTLGAKVAYSSIVQYRADKWEATLRRDAGGLREGFRSYTVGQGRTAILMVHGFGSSPGVFQNVASALAERGYTCRAMCLPGYGLSAHEFAKAGRAQWLAAINDEVARLSADYDHVWLLGHSMGASLAIDYVSGGSRAVDGVVLLAPLIQVSNKRSPILAARTYYELGRHVFAPDELVESAFSPDFHTNEPVANQDNVPFTPFAVFGQVFDIMDSIGRHPAGLTIPTLMVLADDDKVVDSRAAERYFSQVGAARKDLMHVAHSGHIVPLDNGWEHVVERVDSFVRGVEPSVTASAGQP